MKKEKIGDYIVLSNNKETKHIIIFKNWKKQRRFTKINSEIKAEYIRQKKENEAQRAKYRRHIEQSQLTENTLNKRALHKNISAEDEFIQNEMEKIIIREIWKLREPQNRRVYMKVVDGFSYTKIAELEDRDISVIKRSVDAGIENLRKKLKKFLTY